MAVTEHEIINSRAQAIKVLGRLRERLVGFMQDVRKRRWKPSEKAMALGRYQQEVEALTLAILMLEGQRDEGNGHTPAS